MSVGGSEDVQLVAIDVIDDHRRRDRLLIRGTLATGIARFLGIGASFLTLGIASRTLPKADVGLISIVISVWLIVTMFDLGISGALTTRIAASNSTGDVREMHANVRHALAVLSVLGAAIAVVGVVIAAALPWPTWIGGAADSVRLTLVITMLLCGAALPGALGMAIFAGQQRFIYTQVSSAVGSVASVGTSALVALVHPTPSLFVLSMIGCPVVSSLGFTVVAARSVRAEAPGRFDRRRFVDLMRASSYYAVINLTNTVTLSTGTVVVGATRGLEQAAVFNVAIRMFTPLITVLASSGAQLWPAMTDAIGRGDFVWVRTRYKRCLLYSAAITGVASLGLIALGRPIARLWVGPHLTPSISLLAWDGLYAVAVVFAAQSSILLMAVGRTRPVAAVSAATAAVAILASVLFTQAVGSDGAAIGASIACLCLLAPGYLFFTRDTLRGWESRSPRASRNPEPHLP